MNKTQKAALWGLGLAVAGAAACWNGYVVRRYPIETGRLPAGARVRILLLADLHGEPEAWRRKRLAALVGAQRPDLIALSGDIFDDRRPFSHTEDFLRRIAGVAPIFYAVGNHECRTGRLGEIARRAGDCGVTLLAGNWVSACGGLLAVAGAEDWESPQFGSPGAWFSACARDFAPLWDDRRLRVLLSHKPELVRAYFRLPFDLMLSGHTHGGQVRLPGLCNGLYAVRQGLFPRWVGGRYRLGGRDLVVSRGVSRYPALPRVFNPPEVSVIDLTGAAGRAL